MRRINDITIGSEIDKGSISIVNPIKIFNYKYSTRSDIDGSKERAMILYNTSFGKPTW